MKVVQGAPLPLGVSRQKEALNFAVEVKEGKQCTLLLYKCGENVPMEKIPMKEEAVTGTVRCVMLSHQVRGKLPQKEEYPWEDDCPLRIPEEDVIA